MCSLWKTQHCNPTHLWQTIPNDMFIFHDNYRTALHHKMLHTWQDLFFSCSKHCAGSWWPLQPTSKPAVIKKNIIKNWQVSINIIQYNKPFVAHALLSTCTTHGMRAYLYSKPMPKPLYHAPTLRHLLPIFCKMTVSYHLLKPDTNLREIKLM